MPQAETGVLIECYRKIRAVASAVQDPKQITALNVACGALLVALGKDQECEKTKDIGSLISNVFGSQGGFVFVPFL